MKTFYKNQTCYLELAITDIEGNFVISFESGEEVTYIIKKSSDGSTIASGEMIVDGNIWKVAWTPTLVGEYRIEYTTPEGYEDGMETIMVEESTSTAIDEKLNRILGLSQENYRIFNSTYDINNNLLTAMIKIYASASDCDANTNPIATYQVTAVYGDFNRMTSYKVKKV